MKIKFFLPYNTRPGQNIYISGSHEQLGSLETDKAVPMFYLNGVWICEVNLRSSEEFQYSYIIRDDYSGIYCEAGPARRFRPGKRSVYYVHDQWKPYSEESPFLSHAFRNIFFGAESQFSGNYSDTLITCSVNNLPEDSSVLISGSSDMLGKWEENRAVQMFRGEGGIWYAELDRKGLQSGTEYKFIVKTSSGGKSDYIWEDGLNRQIQDLHLSAPVSASLIINNYTVNLPAFKPKYSGTAIPVFSIRTSDGCGIGEFTGLKSIVDLLAETGQRVLQILPVNDTTMTHTWSDSYPYGAISIFALHPLYLNVKQTGIVSDDSFMKSFNETANRLESLEEIDYDAVDKLKWNYIRKIYEQDRAKTFLSKDFLVFFDRNSSWLIPYAAFCYLRDKFGSPKFYEWPEYSNYDYSRVKKLTAPESEVYPEIALHYFVQYHLHKQLSEAHTYANSKGVILKGDIPIGINKNSVEAWSESHLFNFNGQAGAPPDDFSVKGQNWGFPTYNWEIMEKDGYSWWKKRFRKMEEYFDAYRIDHILGFFRIWEIPSNATEGLLGYFNPSLPFSADEIRSMGYNFNYDRDCLPYIKEWVLDELFADKKSEIKYLFLDNIGWDSYRLKSEFSTQEKIEEFFNLNSGKIDSGIKERLMSLVADVLFIQDPADNSRYHPRISSQFTKSYQALSDDQKNSYNRIYNNFFYHRNDGFWYSNAMKKLPSLISSNGMLVCGEDLGMIPSCVPSAMKSLSILTLEIQRMPKDPSLEFGDTRRYPYLSVCTTGTHDTSTLRGWWEENRDTTSSYYRKILNGSGDVPLFCEPWICRTIIENHLKSESMLAIFPLQDWISVFPALRRENPSSERINVPSNPKHYWRYRMHLTAESLISDTEFVGEVRKMVEESNRL
ncbi:MAG: 4-alpha-glucanotransferase [Bacteroidetes bacterium HGW-Bacteroidetes-14]|jgi:4-alpha-glucanotransferase|nr:MAG: 4-alpha-glucanotransferase [Bacteroidetes bacterium HGW-Bacteroidetes-14]